MSTQNAPTSSRSHSRSLGILISWLRGAWLLFMLSGTPAAADDVVLKNLEGWLLEDAEAYLASSGLHFQVAALDDCSTKNTVSKQQPAPLTVLKPKSLVLIWVNNQDGAQVPYVQGQSLETATKNIIDSGFIPVPKVQVQLEEPSNGCLIGLPIDIGIADKVVGTEPQYPAFACKGTEVTATRIRTKKYKTISLPHPGC